MANDPLGIYLCANDYFCDVDSEAGAGMSETKYTPGPWHSSCGCIYAACQLDEYGLTNQAPLAEVTSDEYHDDHYLENCHLIAAAPDLYEAIKELLYALQDDDNWRTSGVYEDAEAALAKARGES